MVDERQLNVIVGMAFRENNAVRDATAAAQKISEVFQNAGSTQHSAFSPQAAEQFGRQLRAAIEQAVNVDLRNSQLYQSVRPVTQKLLDNARTTTQPGNPNGDIARFANEIRRLTQANLAVEQFDKKAAIPLGSKGGFADALARKQGELAAYGAQQAASDALNKAKLRYAENLRRQGAQEVSLTQRELTARGNEIQAIIRNTQRAATLERSKQEALAREILAIGSRARAEEMAKGREIVALNRRKEIDDKLAAAEEARVRNQAEADAAVRSARLPFASPNIQTSIGRSQSTVNQATLTLEAAQLRYARILESETRTAEQVLTAQRAVLSAENALARSHASLASASGTGPGGQGFRQDFITGFQGRGDRPYAEQIGQAFKFSVFYGTAYKLLSGITQTFQQTLQEGIAFQQSVTELHLAGVKAGDNLNQLADTLGQRSAEAGFAPSEGVLTGARSLGLYGATGASQAEQNRIAEISARTVSRLAFTSGMQPADLQANIAAITQAFGQGAQGQIRVADLDAYLGKRFGVAPGQTIQAVSEAGTVGRAAGFSQEQVTAIAADLISRTGQTPAAVAGFMAQIFSRGGEGSLNSVASKYGIDPTLELSKQIDKLARVYKDASPQERAQISAAFGRGKVQNAAIALLQDYSAVRSASNDATTQAGGFGDKAFQERLKNIGGQLQLTVGSMKEFANQLGQSGVLDILGGGVVVFRELVDSATGLLREWNQLPGTIKATAAALIALTVAGRTAAGAEGVQAALGLGPGRIADQGVLRQVSTFPLGYGVADRNGIPQPINSGAGLRALGGAGARGIGAAGEALGLANPIVLAIGGLLAVGALRSSSEKLAKAQDDATTALKNGLGPGASPDDLRARAASLQAAASDQREAAKGFFAGVRGERTPALASARQLEDEAKRLEALAKTVESNAKSATSATNVLISGFDSESLSNSLQLIATNGGTAETQFHALSRALLGTADAATAARKVFRPDQFAAESADSIIAAVQKNAPKRVEFSRASDGSLQPQGPASNSYVRQQFTGNEAARALRDRLGKFGSLADISPQDLDAIARSVANQSGVNFDLPGGDYEGAVKDIKNFLRKSITDTKGIVEATKTLSGPELTNAVNQLVQTAQTVAADRPETDFAGRVRLAQRLVKRIEQAINGSSGVTPAAAQQLAVARRALAESQIAELENLRRVAQQNATSRAQVKTIGRSFFNREIRAAIRGGNQDALVQLVGEAGTWGRKIALQAVNDAIRVAREAIKVRNQAFALFQQQLTRFTGAGPDNSAADGQIKQLQGIKDAITNAVTGSNSDNVFDTGSDLPTYVAPTSGSAADKAAKDKETAAERAAARAAANAVRSESAIAQARADVLSARAAMAKAKKGTVEYYDALSSYYAARNSLTDAILAYRQNRYLLGIDMTDPLAQAQAALKAARDKLRSDAGKGADVRAQDQVDLRNAQAEEEATKFQQRLDAIQTAEQLGQTSHRAYINYLEHEHDRLNSIKNRTFQQQQQLNQIDQLLQETAQSMQGQWNFGDIKLPTPYQIRRRVEELYGDPNKGGSKYDPLGQPLTHPTTVNNINIDGADTGMVKKLLRELVGEYTRTTTNMHRHI